MPKETAKDAAGVALSNDMQNPQPSQALTVTADGDVSGPLQLALSTETQDKLMQALQESLHQVSEGFGDLIAPGKICAMDLPFTVIDAITIPDYVDKKTGEEKVKHIFKLEFEDGRVMLTMQGDARPRRILASMFQQARALGAKAKAGPYRYAPKEVNNINPAYVFVPQKGLEA